MHGTFLGDFPGFPELVGTLYSKCVKIVNSVLFLFSNKMFVIRAEITKFLSN